MTQPLLSAAQIVDAADLAFEVVEVPEWNGTVRIEEMSAAESVQFSGIMDATERNLGMFLIIVFTARDDNHARLFPGDTVDEIMPHIENLKKKSVHVLMRLQKAALRVNKMAVAEQAVLKKD
jgi:hypothetical protein